MKQWFLPLAAALLAAGCAKVESLDSASPVTVDPSGIVWSESLPVPEDGQTVIQAGIGEDPATRSRIQLDGSGTVVKVLWTAGDSFKALFSKSGSNYNTTFTTQDDGVQNASFTSPHNLTGYSNFFCFYPDLKRWGHYHEEKVFGIYLPLEQKAVAGGIEEGLNKAFGYADQLSTSMPEKVKFYNIPSLLKFRLEGGVVSQVKEVSFIGSGTVVGDLVLHRVGDRLVEYPNLGYSDDVKSSRVTLKGDFVAGVDYYIAIWPREMQGFRMEFSDGNGSFTAKRSQKTVQFEASHVKDLGTIDLGDSFVNLNDGSLDPVQYMAASEGTKPVTIAVIPDGFTKEQLPQYEQLAASGIEALFNTEPYKTYRNRFNVYFLKVASSSSGAGITDGNGNVVTPSGGYFNSRWGQNSYGDMRADATVVFDFVRERCPDIVNGIHTINEVPILMIINDTRYGGICWSYSDGKGYGMVPYTYSGDGLRWSLPSIVPTTDDPLPEPVTEEVLQAHYRNTTKADMDEVGGANVGDWRNTLVHEFGGHCFGRLGDEYWSSSTLKYKGDAIGGHSWTVPMGLNNATAPTAVSWQEALNRQDELVARDPNYRRIGVFQGGDIALFGRWRIEKISCMIDNRYYFSAWQRYLITKRIFTLAGDLDSFSFDSWLAKDVTTDPVRDVASSGIIGITSPYRTITSVGPLPPPVLVEE